MNLKISAWQPIIAFLLMMLNLCSGLAGYFVGEFVLYSSILSIVVQAGSLFGVKPLWAEILYWLFIFFLSVTVFTVSFWRIFLKDTTKVLYAQLTLINLMRYLPTYLMIGFFGVLTLFSANWVVNIITQLVN